VKCKTRQTNIRYNMTKILITHIRLINIHTTVRAVRELAAGVKEVIKVPKR
jgi:hypothetical protein